MLVQHFLWLNFSCSFLFMIIFHVLLYSASVLFCSVLLSCHVLLAEGCIQYLDIVCLTFRIVAFWLKRCLCSICHGYGRKFVYRGAHLSHRRSCFSLNRITYFPFGTLLCSRTFVMLFPLTPLLMRMFYQNNSKIGNCSLGFACKLYSARKILLL